VRHGEHHRVGPYLPGGRPPVPPGCAPDGKIGHRIGRAGRLVVSLLLAGQPDQEPFLADGLDRGYAQLVRGVRCRIGDKTSEMTLSATSDAELELWGARRKRDLAEETFGKKIKFTVERT